jgi:glyoxylase-like metal-dependent hydrolase (beta-lactamase superfamily II)
MKQIITCLCLFLTTSIILNAQQNFDTVRIRPTQVATGIYMLKGSGGNIGLLTGEDGLLMIDDQFAPLSERIITAIKTLDPGTIRFLINTHVHGDHSGGNENFKKNGVTIVAHELVRERMMKETVNLRTNKATPPRDKDAWPVVTFDYKMNFHLNNEDIELLHFDPGHTDGDVVIHFKKANVYHTGDAFVRYGYPYIDLSSGGSINGFISTLDKLLLILDDNAVIIPGHGELAKKSDVKVMRDMLTDIRDQVASALKKGKKIEDITGMGITDKYEAQWGAGFIKGKDFVLTVAQSLPKKSK